MMEPPGTHEPLVTLQQVNSAAQYISASGLVRRTPLVSGYKFPSLVADGGKDVDLCLKLESLQHTGSFKIRGMTNCFRLHEALIREHGAVTLSAGTSSTVLPKA